MAKEDEINYPREIARHQNIDYDVVSDYLLRKPFSDVNCSSYLQDISQILSLMPQKPASVLDVGVGSGWTSDIFAQAGYDVVGIDISEDMIEIAKKRNSKAKFFVSDYENNGIDGKFDVAVIYDALHHADSEKVVIQNIFDALKDGGVLITVEPGAGHSQTEGSVQAMANYGTTEKDMPFDHQRILMREVGFGAIDQYIRLSQLPLENISDTQGILKQSRHAFTVL